MFSEIKLFGMQNPIIKEAAEKVGGIVAMSLQLGLSRGAVSQWDEVPLDRVVAVEKLTGVSRQRLRSDVFVYPDVSETIKTKEAA
jgi:DNA-binding transcriptional regulator YdaS (Cro superfamily)